MYRRFPTKEELLEAVFEDAINQLSALAESALQRKDSWQGFVWFLEQLCEFTATDRGAREMAFSKTQGGDQVATARLRLVPQITKLVERAQKDGHLRPDLSPTDMPIFGLLAGTVSEFAGHVDAQLWRRYAAILLDGMRQRRGQGRLEVDALEEEQLDAAMQGWQPACP